MKQFEETVVVTNIERPVHHHFVRSVRSQELGLSYDTHIHPYKVQLMHQLKPADHSQHRRYVEWVLEQQTVDCNFSNKIFFTDESHFTLVGYVNNRMVIFDVLRIIK